MELWPVTALGLIALVAFDLMFGNTLKRRWIVTALCFVLYAVLLISTPSCNRGSGMDDYEGPDIPYSF